MRSGVSEHEDGLCEYKLWGMHMGLNWARRHIIRIHRDGFWWVYTNEELEF